MISPAQHPQFFAALHALTGAIVEAVDAGGDFGADGESLFAALSVHGCTIDQFQSLVGAMIGAGLLCRAGERYFLGDAGLVSVRG